jgi:hypothetical protein
MPRSRDRLLPTAMDDTYHSKSDAGKKQERTITNLAEYRYAMPAIGGQPVRLQH